MAVTITSDNFEEYWLSAMSTHGSALEGGEVPIISDTDEVSGTITMPGVVYSADPTEDSSATAQSYVQIKLTLLSSLVTSAQSALAQLTTDKTTLEGLIATLQQQATEAQAVIDQLDDVSTEAQQLTNYVSQANALITQLTNAISAANTATTAANTAATNAKADYVGSDNYVYHWNSTSGAYERTTLYVKGDTMTWSGMSSTDKAALLAAVAEALDDGNITTTYLADGAVTWAKLATAVQENIEGRLEEITQNEFNEIFD